MHDIFEKGGIFRQPDMEELLNETQGTLLLNFIAHSGFTHTNNTFMMAAAVGQGHSRSPSATSSLSVSSSSVMTASPSSPSLNSVKSEGSASSDTSSKASVEDDTSSSSSGSSDSIVYLKPKPLVKKPAMSFAKLKATHMSAKLASFFGCHAPADIGIEASFAHGRELNKLVEIEEMNERMKNSMEVKFKEEEEEEDKNEVKSQVRVEMDVLLGVLEEKKVSLGPSSAIPVIGGYTGEIVHSRESFEVPEVKGKKYIGNMDEDQFAEFRKQFLKPRKDSGMSAEADMCKRKRYASDEPEQSTTEGKKRVKIEEF